MHVISRVTTAWIAFVVASSTSDFGYSRTEQHLWPRKHKLCAGQLQSPVAISTSKAISLPLPALEMIGYHDFLPMPQVLVNDGRTVKFAINRNATRGKLPYVFGATLRRNQRYEIEQMHFHWGAKNNRGAEHMINGVRYPMEMHIVHRSLAYANFSQALQHEDGLVVVAILFQLQDENNEHLRPFLEWLPNVKWAYTELLVNISMSLTSLVPVNTDVYYTYKGSLTTPPCSEAATWIIFANPVPISFRQMNTFRMLSSGKETLKDNFRRLQDIGQRKVYTRRMNVWLKQGSAQLDFANLSWFWT